MMRSRTPVPPRGAEGVVCLLPTLLGPNPVDVYTHVTTARGLRPLEKLEVSKERMVHVDPHAIDLGHTAHRSSHMPPFVFRVSVTVIGVYCFRTELSVDSVCQLIPQPNYCMFVIVPAFRQQLELSSWSSSFISLYTVQ